MAAVMCGGFAMWVGKAAGSDAMSFGFLCAAFAWSVWWNLDWRRYIKFYVRSGPPYRRSVRIVFRTFFAVCAVGAGTELAQQVIEANRPLAFYRDALGIAALWFVVIVAMVKTVERVASGARAKAQRQK